MLLPIGHEGIEQAAGILLRGGLRVHVLLLVAGGDEAEFHQTAGHRREAQHGQIVLLGTHVLAPRCLTDVLLHVLGQFHAVLHVLVLNELKHDIALWRVRVEALVLLLIVCLLQDDGVLTLSHLQILDDASLLARALARAQGIGLETTRHTPLRQGVDMHGDKQVGLVLVGDLRTAVEFHELIRLAGIDHLHVGAVALHHLSEGEGELQRQVLLQRDGTLRPCVTTAVPGIDHQRKWLVRRVHRHSETKYRYQK